MAELPLEIVYFTDPLCSWCWGFEPQWRRLGYELGGAAVWRYRMGGVIAGWDRYNDPVNDIRRPAQMGPQWLHVAAMTGMPLDARIWTDDPPASSYPACVAVKAAERHSADFGARYLRRLREAVMLGDRNIARREVLISLADETAADCPPETRPDLASFGSDLDDPAVQDAFRDDLKEAAYRGIGRFPALIVKRGATGLVLVGYRPYAALRAAVEQVAGDAPPARPRPAPLDYLRFWGRLTARELAETLERDPAEVARELDEWTARPDAPIVRDGMIYRMRNAV